MVVSDSELIEKLQEFLKEADLNTTTTGSVRRMLEAEFNVDLTEKKAFVKEQVDLFCNEHFNRNADYAVNNEEAAADDDRTPVEDEVQYDGEGNGDGDENAEEKEEEVEQAEEGTSEVGTKKPKKGGGFTKLCSLSPKLQEVVGAPEMARTQVVKKLWAHIQENNLQEPNNRRNILCDEQLRTLFGVDSINMFQMNKALTKHIWPLESDADSPDKPAPKEKQRKQETKKVAPVKRKKGKEIKEEEAEEEDSDEPKPKQPTGFLAPLWLSDALIEFLGTGETELSRSEVVKRIWSYMKLNKLRDPSDGRKIICDEKLKELLGVKSFQGFSVSKHLKKHFLKTG